MIIEGALAHAPVATSRTRTRQTPAVAEGRFSDLLRAGGEVLAAGAEAALRALPGGAVLAAAVRGSADAAAARGAASAAAPGADPTSPSGGSGAAASGDERDLWELTRQSQELNLLYLQLQEEMSRESRRYTTLSNLMKTRHETARAIIANV
jgi:hypothetical protein